MKHKWLVVLTLPIMLLAANPVAAAKYSSSELKQVRSFQKAYKKLSKKTYTKKKLYVKAPNYASPFGAGVLPSSYLKDSLAYVNYYRKLVGLPSEKMHATDNRDAQIGAAVLGALNAKTSLSAHGLIGYRQPDYIDDDTWERAENSTFGNINFVETVSGISAGQNVTDLLLDQNNISGAGDTGHRALILSARATHIGFGAAYGRSNGKYYNVENAMFADDILRKAKKSVVAFPSTKVFPIELLGSDTPWSVYFAHKKITKRPKVYLYDLTAKKKVKASQVRIYGTDYYGEGYTGAVTFYPGKLKLVNTHKYEVNIKGVYKYTFRLFRQKGHN